MGEHIQLNQIFMQIDSNKKMYIDDLKEIIAIPSVSSVPDKLYEVMKMTYWVEDRLKNLKATIETCPIDITYHTGKISEQKPSILLATLGKSARKKTLLVYGQLDVHHAKFDRGWETNPFTLAEKDGYLYGRGVCDEKGSLLCWLHVVEIFHKMKQEVPINIKFIFDTCKEIGSPGLEELLREKKKVFLRDVDYVCIADGAEIGSKPCIVYGARGLCHFHLTVHGSEKDAHSGIYGGVLYEPMADLLHLLGSLHSKYGKIQIPRVNDEVIVPTSEDSKTLSRLSFDVNEARQFTGVETLLHKENSSRILLHRWKLPNLSIHGIDGAFGDAGGRTVIPCKVTAKFSLCLVPNQTTEHVAKCIRQHLDATWAEWRTANSMTLRQTAAVEPWHDNPSSRNYQAARRAVKQATGEEPDLVRYGGAVSGAAALQRVMGRSIVILPLSGRRDGAHGPNERLPVATYIQAHKIVAAYVVELKDAA